MLDCFFNLNFLQRLDDRRRVILMRHAEPSQFNPEELSLEGSDRAHCIATTYSAPKYGVIELYECMIQRRYFSLFRHQTYLCTKPNSAMAFQAGPRQRHSSRQRNRTDCRPFLFPRSSRTFGRRRAARARRRHCGDLVHELFFSCSKQI